MVHDLADKDPPLTMIPPPRSTMRRCMLSAHDPDHHLGGAPLACKAGMFRPAKIMIRMYVRWSLPQDAISGPAGRRPRVSWALVTVAVMLASGCSSGSEAVTTTTVTVSVSAGAGTTTAPGHVAGPGSTAGVLPVPAARNSAPTQSAPAQRTAPVGAATLSRAGAATVVIDAATPAATATAASRALFAQAPLVVIADASNRSAVAAAAAQSARLGAPLLLIDDAGQLKPETLREIARLHSHTAVAVGKGVAEQLFGVPRLTVLSDPSGLQSPAVRPGSKIAVLVPAGTNSPGVQAATASGRAAGALIVPVTGWDLRADPSAITALATQRPLRVLAVGTQYGPVTQLADRVTLAENGVQLPGGGQVLFPGHRLVALYGDPDVAGLGALGQQDLPASIARVKKIAAAYRPLSDVPVVPTFEIIATVADTSPGSDGNYSAESTVADLRPWVQAASKAGVYVVLDLQPGRSNFLTQAKKYTELLQLPGVGLALDPEWRLEPDQIPLQQIGGVDAEEINSVTTWLAALTRANRLPQKLLVLHQFQLAMIRSESALDHSREEVSVLIHMDGQGVPAQKDETWAAVTGAAPKAIPFGWKNFYRKDTPTLTPTQTMNKRPTPLMISYQ